MCGTGKITCKTCGEKYWENEFCLNCLLLERDMLKKGETDENS